MEINDRLNRAAAIVLFGKDNPETQYKIGKLTFNVYTHSFIGKTMFSLLGNRIKEAVLSSKKIYNTVTSGLDIETKELGDKKVSIRVRNDPFPLRYREGIFAAAMEYFGLDSNVQAIKHYHEDHEYILEWEEG